MHYETWTGASISLLSNLQQDGFSGLLPSALKIIVDKYQLDILNAFTAQQTLSVAELSSPT